MMTDRGPRSPSEGAQVTKWVLFLEDRFAIETMHDAPDRECADNSDQRVNMAARGVTKALMKQPEGVRVCGPGCLLMVRREPLLWVLLAKTQNFECNEDPR